jgi:HK97 family phage portal protein
MVIKVPGNLTQQQAQEILRVWNSSHGGGVMNSHKPAVLAGGADLDRIPVNLEDAAFIAQARLSVEDVARIWRLPPHMLGVGDPTGSTAEQESLRFLAFSLMPRLRRIEMAIAHGLPELFGGGTPLRPEFDTSDLLRADTPTKTSMVLSGRQAGWLSINDARHMFSLPPIDGGDTVQVTPVGGAPNLQTEDAGAA